MNLNKFAIYDSQNLTNPYIFINEVGEQSKAIFNNNEEAIEIANKMNMKSIYRKYIVKMII